jgi:hypothetical protein
MFLTTTSFGVSATETTATQVLSTSSVILGCDIQDETSTATTTGGCLPSATTCSEAVIITLSVDVNDSPLTIAAYETGALATSVFDFVESFWSGQSS